MGFTVIGYDDYSDEREEMQAKNIYAQTFAKDPESKVVVWYGVVLHIYSNINKNTQEWVTISKRLQV